MPSRSLVLHSIDVSI